MKQWMVGVFAMTVLVCGGTGAQQTSGGGAATTPRTSLLALSKQDHTLSIINPATLKVVATVPVGDDPHEVVASADGRTAYVSNYGFGAFHTLAVIDLVGQKRMPSIELGALRGPHGLAFAEGKVLFTAEAAKAIGSYDPSTAKVDWIMGTGQDRTHMLYVFPGGKRILTTNVNSATVTLLEKTEGRGGGPGQGPGGPAGGGPGGDPARGGGAFINEAPGGNGAPGGRPAGPPMGPPPGAGGGDWELTVIPVGRGSEGFDVSPDGREAWVANAQDGTISVIDLAAKKVVATLQVNVRGANRLKFTPDGRHVLVSPGSVLVVLDAATRAEVKRLPNVHASGGIQMQPDGARAYVACGEDGRVVAIDLKTLEEVGHVDISGPDGLAWAARE
jgi:YVTN family beta-propeller protein